MSCRRISEGSDYVCCEVRTGSLILFRLILISVSRDMTQTVPISIPGQFCETYVGQSGNGTGFLWVFRVSTVIIIPSVLHTRF